MYNTNRLFANRIDFAHIHCGEAFVMIMQISSVVFTINDEMISKYLSIVSYFLPRLLFVCFCVECSAGLGRSGTFIAIDMGVKQVMHHPMDAGV